MWPARGNKPDELSRTTSPAKKSASGLHWWSVPKERTGKASLHLPDSLADVLGHFSEALGPSAPQLRYCSPQSHAHSQEPPWGLGKEREGGRIGGPMLFWISCKKKKSLSNNFGFIEAILQTYSINDQGLRVDFERIIYLALAGVAQWLVSSACES